MNREEIKTPVNIYLTTRYREKEAPFVWGKEKIVFWLDEKQKSFPNLNIRIVHSTQLADIVVIPDALANDVLESQMQKDGVIPFTLLFHYVFHFPYVVHMWLHEQKSHQSLKEILKKKRIVPIKPFRNLKLISLAIDDEKQKEEDPIPSPFSMDDLRFLQSELDHVVNVIAKREKSSSRSSSTFDPFGKIKQSEQLISWCQKNTNWKVFDRIEKEVDQSNIPPNFVYHGLTFNARMILISQTKKVIEQAHHDFSRVVEKFGIETTSFPNEDIDSKLSSSTTIGTSITHLCQLYTQPQTKLFFNYYGSLFPEHFKTETVHLNHIRSLTFLFQTIEETLDRLVLQLVEKQKEWIKAFRKSFIAFHEEPNLYCSTFNPTSLSGSLSGLKSFVNSDFALTASLSGSNLPVDCSNMCYVDQKECRTKPWLFVFSELVAAFAQDQLLPLTWKEEQHQKIIHALLLRTVSAWFENQPEKTKEIETIVMKDSIAQQIVFLYNLLYDDLQHLVCQTGQYRQSVSSSNVVIPDCEPISWSQLPLFFLDDEKEVEMWNRLGNEGKQELIGRLKRLVERRSLSPRNEE